jgi:Na+-transporting NADH:ubiquinone oxidoreductase subunit NqrC
MKISLKKVNFKTVLVVILVVVLVSSILMAALAVNFLFLQDNSKKSLEKRVVVCEKQIAALKAELEAGQKTDDERRALINKINSLAIRLALIRY